MSINGEKKYVRLSSEILQCLEISKMRTQPSLLVSIFTWIVFSLR